MSSPSSEQGRGFGGVPLVEDLVEEKKYHEEIYRGVHLKFDLEMLKEIEELFGLDGIQEVKNKIDLEYETEQQRT